MNRDGETHSEAATSNKVEFTVHINRQHTNTRLNFFDPILRSKENYAIFSKTTEVAGHQLG